MNGWAGAVMGQKFQQCDRQTEWLNGVYTTKNSRVIIVIDFSNLVQRPLKYRTHWSAYFFGSITPKLFWKCFWIFNKINIPSFLSYWFIVLSPSTSKRHWSRSPFFSALWYSECWRCQSNSAVKCIKVDIEGKEARSLTKGWFRKLGSTRP